ncbi:MAG TPA: uridine-cytidine kinase [Opitutaceae bacterium]|nr:uridine-cytidine kinase [Opitutaceae bacterium]
MSATNDNLLIAIVGGSGAGKTWLVGRLCAILGEKACHLALDDFYRDRSHLPPSRRARLNFDVPHAIDWSDAGRVLRAGRAGTSTAVPQYDFATHSRRAETRRWSPAPVVLVEGLWLLRPPEVRRLFDLSIFLDAPENLRFSRRLARDTAERGYAPAAVRSRIQASVTPMHARYVEPQRRWADVVLAQPFQAADADRLAAALWPLLSARGVLPCGGRETFRNDLSARLVDYAYAN